MNRPGLLFAFRLAGYLKMSVAQLMRDMTATEFLMWQVVDEKFNPFGEWRDDLRSALAASGIVNTLKNAHFKQPAWATAEEFMWQRPKRKKHIVQTATEMKNILMGLVRRWGGEAKQPPANVGRPKEL